MSNQSNRPRRSAGFTLVETMVAILIMSVILTIAVPAWLGARERSQTKSCVAQLRQIKYAKESWAMEHKKEAGDRPEWSDLYPAYLKEKPACPAGGEYAIGDVDTDPTCSVGGDHFFK